MAGTTIRVDVRTHAMLRDLSKQEHTSTGQVVTDLVEKHRKERFWLDLEESLDRLKADPVAWRDYQEEMALWDSLAGERSVQSGLRNLGACRPVHVNRPGYSDTGAC